VPRDNAAVMSDRGGSGAGGGAGGGRPHGRGGSFAEDAGRTLFGLVSSGASSQRRHTLAEPHDPRPAGAATGAAGTGVHRVGYRADARTALPAGVAEAVASDSPAAAARYSKALKLLGLAAPADGSGSSNGGGDGGAGDGAVGAGGPVRRNSAVRLSSAGVARASFAGDGGGGGRDRGGSDFGAAVSAAVGAAAGGGGSAGGYSKAFKLLGLGGGGGGGGSGDAASGGSAAPSHSPEYAGGRTSVAHRHARTTSGSAGSAGSPHTGSIGSGSELGGLADLQSRHTSLADGSGSGGGAGPQHQSAAQAHGGAAAAAPSGGYAFAIGVPAQPPTALAADAGRLSSGSLVALHRLSVGDGSGGGGGGSGGGGDLPHFIPSAPAVGGAGALVAGSSSSALSTAPAAQPAPQLFLPQASFRLGVAVVDVNLRDEAPAAADGATAGGSGSAGSGGKYAVYLIRVTVFGADGGSDGAAAAAAAVGDRGKSWLVQRRYREFVALDRALSLVVPAARLPNLPGRTGPAGVLGGLKAFQGPALVRQRVRELQAYLRMVVRIPQAWGCDALLAFLDGPKRTLTTQAQYARTLTVTHAVASATAAAAAASKPASGAAAAAVGATTVAAAAEADLTAAHAQLAALRARLDALAGKLSEQAAAQPGNAALAAAAAAAAGTDVPHAAAATTASTPLQPAQRPLSGRSSVSSTDAAAAVATKVASLTAALPQLVAASERLAAQVQQRALRPAVQVGALPPLVETPTVRYRSRSTTQGRSASFSGPIAAGGGAAARAGAPSSVRLRAAGFPPQLSPPGSARKAPPTSDPALGSSRIVAAALEATSPGGAAALLSPGGQPADPQLSPHYRRPSSASIVSSSSASFLWGHSSSFTGPDGGAPPLAVSGGGGGGSFASHGSRSFSGSLSASFIHHSQQQQQQQRHHSLRHGGSVLSSGGSFTGSFNEGDIDDIVSVILGALPRGSLSAAAGGGGGSGGGSLSSASLAPHLGRSGSMLSRLSAALQPGEGSASFRASLASLSEHAPVDGAAAAAAATATTPGRSRLPGRTPLASPLSSSTGRRSSQASFHTALSHSFYAAVHTQLTSGSGANSTAAPSSAASTASSAAPHTPAGRRRAFSDSALPELRRCVDALVGAADAEATGELDPAAAAAVAAAVAAREHDEYVASLQQSRRVASETAALAAVINGGGDATATAASAASVTDALDAVADAVAPTHESNERRRDIAGFITSLLRNACGLEAVTVGATASGAYTPSAGIDLVVLLPALTAPVVAAAAGSAEPASASARTGGKAAGGVASQPPQQHAPSAAASADDRAREYATSASGWFVGVSEALCRAAAATQAAALSAGARHAAHVHPAGPHQQHPLTGGTSGGEEDAAARGAQQQLAALASSLRAAVVGKKSRLEPAAAANLTVDAFHALRRLVGEGDESAGALHALQTQLAAACERIAASLRESRVLNSGARDRSGSLTPKRKRSSAAGQLGGASSLSPQRPPTGSPTAQPSASPLALQPIAGGASPSLTPLPSGSSSGGGGGGAPDASPTAGTSSASTSPLAGVELDVRALTAACGAAAVARVLLEVSTPGGRDLEVVEDSALTRLLRRLAAGDDESALAHEAAVSHQPAPGGGASGGGGGNGGSLWASGLLPSWAVAADGAQFTVADVVFDASAVWPAFSLHSGAGVGGDTAQPPPPARPFLTCTVDNVTVTVAAAGQHSYPQLPSLQSAVYGASGTVPSPSGAATSPSGTLSSPSTLLPRLELTPALEVGYPLWLEDADAVVDGGLGAAADDLPASVPLPSTTTPLDAVFAPPGPAWPASPRSSMLPSAWSTAEAAGASTVVRPLPRRRHLLKRSILLLTAWLRQESLVPALASPGGSGAAGAPTDALLLADSTLQPLGVAPASPASQQQHAPADQQPQQQRQQQFGRQAARLAQQLPPRALHAMVLALFAEAAKQAAGGAAAASQQRAPWRAALPRTGTFSSPAQVFTSFVTVYASLDLRRHVVSPLAGIVPLQAYGGMLSLKTQPTSAATSTSPEGTLGGLFRWALGGAVADVWATAVLHAALPVASRGRAAALFDGDGGSSGGAAPTSRRTKGGASSGGGAATQTTPVAETEPADAPEAPHADGGDAAVTADAAAAAAAAAAPPLGIVDRQRSALLKKLRGGGSVSSSSKAPASAQPAAAAAAASGGEGDAAPGSSSSAVVASSPPPPPLSPKETRHRDAATGVSPSLTELLTACPLPDAVRYRLWQQGYARQLADGVPPLPPLPPAPAGVPPQLWRLALVHLPHAMRAAVNPAAVAGTVGADGASQPAPLLVSVPAAAAAGVHSFAACGVGSSGADGALSLVSWHNAGSGSSVHMHVADPLQPWVNLTAAVGSPTVARLQLACAAARSTLAGAAAVAPVAGAQAPPAPPAAAALDSAVTRELFPGLHATMATAAAADGDGAPPSLAARALSLRPDLAPYRGPQQPAAVPVPWSTLRAYARVAADVAAASTFSASPAELSPLAPSWAAVARGALRLHQPLLLQPPPAATATPPASVSPLSVAALPLVLARDYAAFVTSGEHSPRAVGAALARMCAPRGAVPVGHVGQAVKTHAGCGNLLPVLKQVYGGLRSCLSGSLAPLFTLCEDASGTHYAALAGRAGVYPHLTPAANALLAAAGGYLRAVAGLEDAVARGIAPRVYVSVARAVACGAAPSMPRFLLPPYPPQSSSLPGAPADAGGDDDAAASTAALLHPPAGVTLPVPAFVPPPSSPVPGGGGGAASPAASGSGGGSGTPLAGAHPLPSPPVSRKPSGAAGTDAGADAAGGGAGGGVTVVRALSGPAAATARAAVSTAFVILEPPASGVAPTAGVVASAASDPPIVVPEALADEPPVPLLLALDRPGLLRAVGSAVAGIRVVLPPTPLGGPPPTMGAVGGGSGKEPGKSGGKQPPIQPRQASRTAAAGESAAGSGAGSESTSTISTSPLPSEQPPSSSAAVIVGRNPDIAADMATPPPAVVPAAALPLAHGVAQADSAGGAAAPRAGDGGAPRAQPSPPASGGAPHPPKPSSSLLGPAPTHLAQQQPSPQPLQPRGGSPLQPHQLEPQSQPPHSARQHPLVPPFATQQHPQRSFAGGGGGGGTGGGGIGGGPSVPGTARSQASAAFYGAGGGGRGGGGYRGGSPYQQPYYQQQQPQGPPHFQHHQQQMQGPHTGRYGNPQQQYQQQPQQQYPSSYGSPAFGVQGFGGGGGGGGDREPLVLDPATGMPVPLGLAQQQRHLAMQQAEQQQQQMLFAAAQQQQAQYVQQAQVQAYMQQMALLQQQQQLAAAVAMQQQHQQQQVAAAMLARAYAQQTGAIPPPEGASAEGAAVDGGTNSGGAGSGSAVTASQLLGHLQYPDGTLVPVALGSDGQAYAVVSHSTQHVVMATAGGSGGGSGDATAAAASAPGAPTN
jgi:hypothetical protein